MVHDQLVAKSVLAWARDFGRRPPWRTCHELYPLAVAEILLQKTKSHDVEPIWRILIGRYPDVGSLSDAPYEDIRSIVASLGLRNQRTSRLKAFASALKISPYPEKLPSIGSYGSAVIALAMDRAVIDPPVDGNIARVITRLHGMSFPRGEARKKSEVKSAVSTLLATQTNSSNQLALVYALVDLGASVCSPTRPTCKVCPLEQLCTSVTDSVS